MLLVRLVGRTILRWFCCVQRSRKPPDLAVLALTLSFIQPVAGQNLQLTVTEGDGLQVVAGSRSFGGVSVVITNTMGSPVAGAKVTFRLPENGPSGTFPNATRIETQTSDAQGKAAAWGIQWGPHAGDCHVAITAHTSEGSAGTTARIRIVASDDGAKPAASASFEVDVPKSPTTPAVPVAEPQQPPGPLEKPADKRPGVLLTRTEHTEERISRGRGKWVAIVLGVAGAAGGFTVYRLYGKQPPTAAPATVTTGTALTLGTPTISIGKP